MKKERWEILTNNPDFLIWEPSRSTDRKMVISRIGVRHTEGGNPIPFEYAIWKEAGGWDRQLFPDHVNTFEKKKIYALAIWRLEG